MYKRAFLAQINIRYSEEVHRIQRAQPKRESRLTGTETKRFSQPSSGEKLRTYVFILYSTNTFIVFTEFQELF